MKKTFKIISILLIILILNFATLVNVVQAVENQSCTIYVKEDFKRVIKRNGIIIKTAHAVYMQDGQEHQAYCLNRELKGVGEHIATYDVANQGKITDEALWKVIINGYPYKSIEQLGVADEAEAYIATKQAIYCHIYNTDLAEYSAIGTSGQRVINAIKLILENAKNTTENFQEQSIKVIQSEEWETDSKEPQYLSKQYEIKSNVNISKIVINLENQLEGTKVTDLENKEKTEFNSNQKFKILIPINRLEEAGEFKIKIQTEMETKPIFFGKSPDESLQDYALTAFSYEDVDTELIQDYPQNETQIIIEKIDDETGEKLENAKFEISNEQNQIIAIQTTNEQGQIIIEQLLPGKYYIKEIEAPEGYEVNTEIVQIEVSLNEKQIVEIKNKKKPEEPPVEKIIIPEDPPIVEIPKLPVTGM